MNKITITVEAGTHSLTREYSLDSVLEEGTDLNERVTDMLETIKGLADKKF